MKNFLLKLIRRQTTEQNLTSSTMSVAGLEVYQQKTREIEMSINYITQKAVAKQAQFNKEYGSMKPFYTRMAGILSHTLGREVSLREIALFELAHAQTRIAMNEMDPNAYHDMIIASSAAAMFAHEKTHAFEETMLTEVEAALSDTIHGESHAS
jgi:hypothetical protein